MYLVAKNQPFHKLLVRNKRILQKETQASSGSLWKSIGKVNVMQRRDGHIDHQLKPKGKEWGSKELRVNCSLLRKVLWWAQITSR